MGYSTVGVEYSDVTEDLNNMLLYYFGDIFGFGMKYDRTRRFHCNNQSE